MAIGFSFQFQCLRPEWRQAVLLARAALVRGTSARVDERRVEALFTYSQADTGMTGAVYFEQYMPLVAYIREELAAAQGQRLPAEKRVALGRKLDAFLE